MTKDDTLFLEGSGEQASVQGRADAIRGMVIAHVNSCCSFYLDR